MAKKVAKTRIKPMSVFKFLILIGLIGIVFVLSLFLLVKWEFLGDLPSYAELRNIKNPVASEIYDVNGKLIDKFYFEDRTNVKIKDINPFLVNALIATEDIRFHKHNGVDKRSMARVFFKTIILRKDASGGGSTITQQLVKNLYPRQEYWMLSTVVNKFREIVTAIRIEKVYEKEEILQLYLNTVSFGERAFGIGTATQRFFSQTPAGIPPEQAATLIGMLKAPTYYSPRVHPDNSLRRRNTVLAQMKKYGKINEEEFITFSTLPIGLKYRRLSDGQTMAPYFRSYLEKELKTWSNDTENKPEKYNIYTDGLKVYTSINADMQSFAEEAVSKHMAELQGKFLREWGGKFPLGKNDAIINDAIKRTTAYKNLKKKGLKGDELWQAYNTFEERIVFSWNGEERRKMTRIDSLKHYLQTLNSSFLAMDPNDGWIKAYVGGINFKYFNVDHVLENRQVGSTFKPFVYASALRDGISPCQYYDNEQKTYKDYKNWSPRNANNTYGGSFALHGALSHSVNTVSVQVLLEVGMNKVRDLLYEIGIMKDIPKGPSIALGTAELSLMDMVQAYSTFANGGNAITPKCILRIEDNNGLVLEDFTEDEEKENEQILSTPECDMMNEMLKRVVNNGTAKRLRFQYGLKSDIAGKTGTTQNQSDGWFIGYTPDLVAGAWVGAEDRRIHFKSMATGQGARSALPIFGSFMKSCEHDAEIRSEVIKPFPAISDSIFIEMDCVDFSEQTAEEMNTMFQPDRLEEIIENIFRKDKGKKRNRRSKNEVNIDREIENLIQELQQKMEKRKKRRKKSKKEL